MDPGLLVWLVPVFPLLGYLIIAFFGRQITGAPLPVVEAGGPEGHDGHAATTAPAENAGPSDAPAFVADPATTASGHDAGAPAVHDDHAGGHGEDVHLSRGGTWTVGFLATLLVFLSFGISCYLLYLLTGMQGEERRIFSPAFTWMAVPAMGSALPKELLVRFQLVVDPLSCLMLLIVTGVGGLIHLYSTGYMSHDKGHARYFGYLNLFVFFMLLLVMGANFLVMFVGWEGVGLCSYLLIGFWYERKSATDAGKKAFIVNRVGDFGFLIGLFLIFQYFGTFDFYGDRGVLTAGGLAVASAAGYIRDTVLLGAVAATVVPLCLFVGATGKSAQIPLFVWLPDAMEGPTPVSALIHAATMVTAGVYMVCRVHPLFLLSPLSMHVVAIIGLATALLAATIGLVQNDIKRVLAYSTVSQLGYMFLGAGVGAFGMAMFHVTTHAFFKALLFLGSGSVIHAMSGEQDMRNMGGLRKVIKVTWLTMLIGTLAIAGIPLLSGFFSKDEILLNAYASPQENGLGHPALWAIGWVVAGLTAFYMTRLMMKTFEGQPRMSPEVGAHVHESPPSMTVPLIVLAVLSVVGGYLNPGALGAFGLQVPHYLEHFLGDTVGWREQRAQELAVPHGTEVVLVVLSGAIAIVVCLFAWWLYSTRAVRGQLATQEQKQRNVAWRVLYNKWYVDDLYNGVFAGWGKRLAGWLWQGFDVGVIDGLVNGVAGGIGRLSNALRGWQSGYVRNYALTMLIGIVLVILGVLFAVPGAMGGLR